MWEESAGIARMSNEWVVRAVMRADDPEGSRQPGRPSKQWQERWKAQISKHRLYTSHKIKEYFHNSVH